MRISNRISIRYTRDFVIRKGKEKKRKDTISKPMQRRNPEDPSGNCTGDADGDALRRGGAPSHTSNVELIRSKIS